MGSQHRAPSARMRRLVLAAIVLLSLRLVLTRSGTAELCEPLTPNSTLYLSLNFTALPKGARAHVCGRNAMTPLIFIEDFLTAREVEKALLLEYNAAAWKRPPAHGTESVRAKAKVNSSMRSIVIERVLNVTAVASPRWDARSGAVLPMLPDYQWIREENTHEQPVHLHTDRNGRAERFLSVLLYMQRPIAGGHTLFPAMETRRGVPASAQALHQRVKETIRTHHQPASSHHKGFFMKDVKGAREMCAMLRDADRQLKDTERQSAHPNYPYFAVAPLPGSAAIWWHWGKTKAGMAPDVALSAWHGGCGVIGQKVLFRAFLHVPELLNCSHTEAGSPVLLQPHRVDCADNSALVSPLSSHGEL